MSVFEDALKHLIDDEGEKFVDDPDDSGGPTKFGITQKAYSQFLGYPVTREMMQALTLDDAKPFYRHEFWTPLSCGRIKDPAVAIALLDCAVLYGITEAGIMTQQALNLEGALLRVDGSIGERTIEWLNKASRFDFLKNLQRFILRRIDHLVKVNPKNEKYRAGWENRAGRLLTLNQLSPFNRGTSL